LRNIYGSNENYFLQQSLGQWQKIFYATVAFYAVEVVVYFSLGSGETQTWNKPQLDQQENTIAKL